MNLATEQHGFITYFNIEDGNPAGATLYRPVLDACQADYQSTPESVVADGGYASHDNAALKPLAIRIGFFTGGPADSYDQNFLKMPGTLC